MKIEKVFIVGAGSMGTGIAQVFAQSGFEVILNDENEEQLNRALKKIERLLEREVAKGNLTEATKSEILKNISLSKDLSKVHEADLIIEAIIEDLDLKKDLFIKISELCANDAILASNTSTIPITSMGAVVKRPENFIGMHFFNPVPLMNLLEIVKGYETSEGTIEIVKEIGARLNKVTIVSKDSSGFIVNRMFSPMLNAAVNLVDSGVGTIEDIDKGMKFGCNHPMGPLELIDFVGADIQLAVMEVLYQEFGDPQYKPAALLKRMVAAGHLGRKTGKGFYTYNKEN